MQSKSFERERRKLMTRSMRLMWTGLFLSVVGFGLIVLTHPMTPVVLAASGYFAGVSGIVIVVSTLVKATHLVLMNKTPRKTHEII